MLNIKLSDIAKSHSKHSLILHSESPWDYEPIISLQKFMRFERINNEAYLEYVDEKVEDREGLGKQLSQQLKLISETGIYNRNNIFKELSSINPENECILISFSDNNDINYCQYKIKF